MKEIAVTDEQYEYIDGLREALAAEHVDRYGHVRTRDAVQFLLDTHDAVGGVGGVGGVDPRPEGASGEAAGETRGEVDPEPDASDEVDGDEAESDGGAGESGDDRLDAMLNLLETHTEKWGETPSERGRYEVQLPDGELEVVQTRDDVRAVLFKHYR